MNLTQNELEAVNAGGHAARKGDSLEQLLARQMLKTAPVIANGSIATGGVAQTLLEASSTRTGVEIQNTSDADLWVRLTAGSAAVNTGFKLAAGQAWNSPAGLDVTGAISIYGATTGKTFYSLSF